MLRSETERRQDAAVPEAPAGEKASETEAPAAARARALSETPDSPGAPAEPDAPSNAEVPSSTDAPAGQEAPAEPDASSGPEAAVGPEEAMGDEAAPGSAPAESPNPAAAHAPSGIASLASGSFSVMDSVGGVRGIVESVLPELAFLVLYLVTGDLTVTVVASLVLCAAELVARLVQRQTVVGALTGTVIVLICLFAAYRTHDARNYYLPACVINAAWAAVLLVSLAARRPGIGCIVELIANPPTESFRAWYEDWYADLPLRRAYVRATWLWVAMFVLRDAFQVPLMLMGSVAVLGTVTLVLGVPLFALVCWLSYLIIGTPLHEHRKRANTEAEAKAEAEAADQLAAEPGAEAAGQLAAEPGAEAPVRPGAADRPETQASGQPGAGA